MTDIVICSLPSLFVDRMPGAPAVLKSAAETAGFKSVALDLNLEFFIDQCQSKIELFHSLGSAFRPSETADLEAAAARQQWLDSSMATLKNHSPKLVGLSAFSGFQHRAIFYLAQRIRTEMPETKIVVGGFGLKISSNSLNTEPGVSKLDMIKPFHQFISEKKLADYIVTGPGLDDLVSILEKEIGVNTTAKTTWENGKVVYNTPIPNYDDYRIHQYVWNEDPALPITGSRGCVRACTFCDIPGQFGRFKYRTGEDIANEMIHLHQTHRIRTFEFTDSLVNGSLKAFRQWVTILAEYNRSRPREQWIRWFGQYICRPQSQMPEDLYALMHDSGVTNVVVGAESGNNEVLKSMKKMITVQDLYDEFAMFKKYKIKAHVLMLSGFHNETWERYLDTLKFIVKCQSWVSNGVITKLSINNPLFINNLMPLYEQAEELGILVDHYREHNWTSKNDPDNDYAERVNRRVITEVLINKLGISMAGSTQNNMWGMYNRLQQHKQELEQELNELRSSHTATNH